MDAQPGFDVAALDEWIGDRLPGYGPPLTATRMGQGTGEANALYWLRRGRHVWVLRCPPAVINAPGASDMNREWRILTALDGSQVPHPAPLLRGSPDSPLGTPFLIMAKVDGFTPVGVLPEPYDTPQGRRELGFALVDALAELAALPWQARGLDGLGRPAGFLDRQVSRWLSQLDWPAETLQQAREGVPLRRAGQPADLVGTALWLASQASGFVTGVLIRVDGGNYRQTS